jgi:two-component system sensor histidine kinase CpxA
VRGIFVTIFLWFWLALTLMATAVAVVTWLYPYDGGPPSLPPFLERMHRLQVTGAVAILDERGLDAFRDHRRQLDRLTRLRTWFIDDGGRDVAGIAVPAPVRAFGSDAAFDDSGKATGTIDDAPAIAWRLERSDGSPLVVVAQAQGFEQRAGRAGGEQGDRRAARSARATQSVWNRLSQPMPVFIARIAAVVLVGGLGCWLLARHVSAPVRRLQKVVRRFASGDLAARSDEGLFRRRDEIGDLSRDVNTMADRVEALLGAQQRLLQDVSHELRSPLARLHLALELARGRGRGDGDAEREAHLDRVGREADRLDGLIGQLLVLSRLESAAAPRAHEPVALLATLRDVVADADFEAKASGRGVELGVDGDHEWLLAGGGSPSLVRSAFDNIVRNAIQHAPPATVVEVRAEATADGSRLRIAVRDHGPGVPDEALPLIFQPFYRVADASGLATARPVRPDGTGLGLAIADRAIRSHGGTVVAANAADGGLIVTIDLPAQPAPHSTTNHGR